MRVHSWSFAVFALTISQCVRCFNITRLMYCVLVCYLAYATLFFMFQ